MTKNVNPEKILELWNDAMADEESRCRRNILSQHVADIIYPDPLPEWAVPYSSMLATGYEWPGMIAIKPECMPDMLEGGYDNLLYTRTVYELRSDGTEAEVRESAEVEDGKLYGIEVCSLYDKPDASKKPEGTETFEEPEKLPVSQKFVIQAEDMNQAEEIAQEIYKVWIEEHICGQFEVRAKSLEHADEIARKKYDAGEFVVNPDGINVSLMAIAEPGHEEPDTDWYEV